MLPIRSPICSLSAFRLSDSATLAADAVEPSVIEQTEPQQGTDSSAGQKETAALTETGALSGTELQAPLPPTEASESLAHSAQGFEDGQGSQTATTVSHNNTAVLAEHHDHSSGAFSSRQTARILRLRVKARRNCPLGRTARLSA